MQLKIQLFVNIIYSTTSWTTLYQRNKSRFRHCDPRPEMQAHFGNSGEPLRAHLVLLFAL